MPTTISFDIPSASTPYIIALKSPLPNITQPVVIDAATQPGYLVSPIVELDGQGAVANGFSLLANSNTVEGLELVDFAMSGILIQSNDNLVSGNFIGTDPTGSSPGPGDSIGISIAGIGQHDRRHRRRRWQRHRVQHGERSRWRKGVDVMSGSEKRDFAKLDLSE